MQFYGVSHIGNVRENNEDHIFLSSDKKLFIVADGMGGANSGELASKMAIEVFTDRILGTNEIDEKFIYDSILQANNEIFNHALTDLTHKGMGTTFSGIIFISDKEYITFHIGDSGIVKFNGKGVPKILTEEHTVYNELLKRGSIIGNSSDFEKRSRHMLMKALGVGDEIEVDIERGKYKKGDSFIIYSDGLSNYINAENMGSYLEFNAEIICKTLLSDALSKGGKDNISIICIKTAEVK